jgi:Family of unknown function (DUF6152)
MLNILRGPAIVVALLILTPLALQAHHGGSMFETQKEITVNGVVKEFQYTNPHAWLLVDVTNKDGSVTTWGFESEGPGVLLRNGIHKADLTPGTKVTVTGHPMKNGQTAASWIKAVRADGVVFDPRLRSGDGPPASGNDVPSPQ